MIRQNFSLEKLRENDNIRNMLMASSRRIRQQIPVAVVGSYIAGSALQIPVQIQNTGLLEKLIVLAEFDVAQGAAETQTRTALGGINAFSNVQFQDFNNIQRINTNSAHLHFRRTGLKRVISAAAYTTDSVNGFGSNYNVMKTPSPVTTQQTMYAAFEVPLAYSDATLEGAVYAGLASSNAYLTLTVNPNFFVSSTGNPVQACYQSSTAQLGKINAIRITLIQQYRDALPVSPKGLPMLPPIDLATEINLINTSLSGLVAGSNTLFNFPNFREHRSLTVVYDNAGVLSSTGADMNYFKLQAANQTVLDYRTPNLAKYYERELVGDDFPGGVYYFDYRDSPIDTLASGNTQLQLNPATVTGASSQFLFFMEYAAIQQLVANASSVGS